jgi:RHS repeat-associated protein
MKQNGELYYLLSDHLGSTSLTTNASGAVVSELRYTAWGETRYSSDTTPTQQRYTSQFSYEQEFGLYFYQSRWYDSSLGRFAQADSIIPGGVQGLDRYAYANNDPVNFIDPSGHRACDDTDANGSCISYDEIENEVQNPYGISQYDIEKVANAQDGYEHWLTLGIQSINNLRAIKGWWSKYLDPRNGMDVWKFLLTLSYALEGYSIPVSSESVFFVYMTDAVINKAGGFYKQYGIAGLYLYLGTREAFTDRTTLDSNAPNWLEGTVEYRNTWDFGPGASGNPWLAKADRIYSTAETNINLSWGTIQNYDGHDMYGTGATDYGVHPGVSMDGKHVIWQLSVSGTNHWSGASSSVIFVIDN